MPWTIPTYAGTPMGGVPSKARTAMFELCRAVNERQEAIGITKTGFRKADGNTGSDLTTDDLAQIKCAGTNSNAIRNLKSIRDAILSMVNAGYFLETSGGTAWTKANLEADIGTDLDADPIRPQEARYWQAMQDALDRLIYASREVVPEFVSYIGSSRGETKSTLQAAWDARHFESNPTTSLDTCFWLMAGAGSLWRASVLTGRVFDFDVPAYQGIPTGCAYQLLHKNAASIDVNYSAGSFSGSMAAGEALVSSSWKESAVADIALNDTTSISVEITTSQPSTVPFSGAAETRIYLYKARVYFDIATVLTDQA